MAALFIDRGAAAAGRIFFAHLSISSEKPVSDVSVPSGQHLNCARKQWRRATQPHLVSFLFQGRLRNAMELSNLFFSTEILLFALFNGRCGSSELNIHLSPSWNTRSQRITSPHDRALPCADVWRASRHENREQPLPTRRRTDYIVPSFFSYGSAKTPPSKQISSLN